MPKRATPGPNFVRPKPPYSGKGKAKGLPTGMRKNRGKRKV